MIKITKEEKFWANPSQVVALFLSSTKYAKSIPIDHIGYVDESLGGRSLTVFPGTSAPVQSAMPRKGYQDPVLVHAPVEDVQAFSLTSVSGVKVFGGREDNGNFQVVVQWEVLSYREGIWHFLAEPVYLHHLRVKVEYTDAERKLIRGVLDYDPFRQ